MVLAIALSLRDPSAEGSIDTRTVQDLLGHADGSATMIYLRVTGRPGAGEPSPLDMG